MTAPRKAETFRGAVLRRWSLPRLTAAADAGPPEQDALQVPDQPSHPIQIPLLLRPVLPFGRSHKWPRHPFGQGVIPVPPFEPQGVPAEEHMVGVGVGMSAPSFFVPNGKPRHLRRPHGGDGPTALQVGGEIMHNFPLGTRYGATSLCGVHLAFLLLCFPCARGKLYRNCLDRWGMKIVLFSRSPTKRQ